MLADLRDARCTKETSQRATACAAPEGGTGSGTKTTLRSQIHSRTWVLGAPPGVSEYPDCRSELIGVTLPNVICTVASHLLTVK